MFKRELRCIDCGFLTSSDTITDMQGGSVRYFEVVSSASLAEREQGVRRPSCFRGAADFRAETKALFTPDEDDDNDARSRKHTEAQWRVISEPRMCGYFERNRAGLTPEGHLDLQHKREDRYWTAGVALIAAIIGGVIASMPALLFGDRIIEIVVK